MMTRNLIAAVLAPILTIVIALSVLAQAGAAETDRILDAGEACFKAMQQKDYAAIWESLSAKPQAAIAGDIAKRAAHTYSKEQIETDFTLGALIAKSYWDEYLFYFDPDMALEQSRWEMGSIGKQQAEIILQYKKAEQPARLKLFKEGNHMESRPHRDLRDREARQTEVVT